MIDHDASLTWTDLWADCTQSLGNSDEARVIIEQASGRQGAPWLITMTKPAPPSAAGQVDEMMRRRLAGEPLQYVVGRWGFRQLNLRVDPRVLIPRPETEQVVEAAIHAVNTLDAPVVVDLGTGSGAIALSLALEVHESQVYATDVSADALEVAALNLVDLPVQASQRVQLLQGSWFDALPLELKGNVDLIISNPPYIGEQERGAVEQVVLDWEPQAALFSGPEGMDALTLILQNAASWLSPRGSLVVELAPQQAQRVEKMAWDAGFFSVATGTDLALRKRWLVATKAS